MVQHMLQQHKMYSKFLISLIMIICCTLTGCNIITEPNPLIGYYIVPTPGVVGAYSYTFALYADGTYDMIQYAESKGYVMSGEYVISLSSFDFESATGRITFTVDEQDDGLYSYCFTKGVDNIFIFEWDGSSSPSCSLKLSMVSGGNDFPSEAVSTRERTFNDELERWTNTGTEAPDDGTSGTDDGATTDDASSSAQEDNVDEQPVEDNGGAAIV